MNEGPDTRSEDADFDKYLARQSSLSQQYHAAIDDEPASSIDAAIKFRAAAQAQRLRLRRYARWTVPVALAASVVLAVTAVLQAPSNQWGGVHTVNIINESKVIEQAPSEVVVDISPHSISVPPPDMAIESPAPAAPIAMNMPRQREERADKAEKKAQHSEARAANVAPERDAVSASEAGALISEPLPSQPVAAPSFTPELAIKPAPAAPTAAIQSQKPSESFPVSTMAKRAAQGAVTQDASASSVKKPEDWLQEIALLRKQGKVFDAEAQMKEFRAHYPDYQIPAPAQGPPSK